MTNQFIDLEAQVDSNQELSDEEDLIYSDFIDDTPRGKARDALPLAPLAPFPSSSSTITPSFRPSFLSQVVDQIQHKYVDSSSLGHVREPEDLNGVEKPRFLLTDDWRLWRVKCKPSQEYFLVYEVMLKHQELKSELRSVFYTPRDIGFLYLEARFSRTGPRSLREVLRAFSDIRISSLALVPETDLRKCLHIGSTENDMSFAPHQWVQVKRGIYKGDIGLIRDVYHGVGSSRGVKVWVIPRLGLTDEDLPSSSPSKRKRSNSRPPLKLFDRESSIQFRGLSEVGEFQYSYKSWSFEFGLQVKVFNPSSLCSARHMSTGVYTLFMEAQRLAGDRFLFEEATMPLPSCWRFELGEAVLVYDIDGNACEGTVCALSDGTQCEVDVLDKGLQVVRFRNLVKVITLGEYIQVLAGVHVGKVGFVVAQSEAHLGVCIGAHTNGVDFLVHANSVKLSTPEYTTTEMPWINVEVTLIPEVYIGRSGRVKHVSLDSTRSLRLLVQLFDGQTVNVGYYDVRERWSGKALASYQPLERHQQMYSADIPWKEVHVRVVSGYYCDQQGIIKNVRRDLMGSLRLSLYLIAKRCSIDIDYVDVVELQSGASLLQYCPLNNDQLQQFGVDSSIQAMRTGPVPWLGLKVDFVKGSYKGEFGVVRGVDRHSSGSGLLLTVERYTFTSLGSNRLVKIDYSDVTVRYHKTNLYLSNVYEPTAKQSFYLPNVVDTQDEHTSSVPEVLPLQAPSTPMPTELEKWTIFTGPWSASYDYSPQSPIPSPFRSLSPSSPSSSTSLPQNDEDHPNIFGEAWILHPGLLGIEMQVDIQGGNLDTSNKKTGVFVKRIESDRYLEVLSSERSSRIRVPYQSIIPFHDRPKPATEKRLMVVVRNSWSHIGKLVRQIHHFYQEEKTEENHFLFVTTVHRYGLQEEIGDERFGVHPRDLEFVKETSQERKFSRALLKDLRSEFLFSPVEIRPSATDPYSLL